MSFYSCFFLFTVLSSFKLSHASELEVKTIKEGKDCDFKAENGDFLHVHYVGRLDNEEGKIFDSSRERGRPFEFLLGDQQVIQGYERGLPGMCVGEIRTLTVPPELAYGENGVRDIIPGGATLHFTVELIKIERENSKREL